MQTVLSADGTTIAYQRSGAGPAVVLVVGAFCDRHSTASLAARLAPTFTVYEYDRRGRGDSGDTAPYAVDREVEDLAAVVAAADGPVRVFGHSSGAALALEAAAGGVAIDRMVVYEPPYTGRTVAAVAEELTALVDAGREDDAVARFLGLVGTPPEAVGRMRAGPRWAYLRSFAATLPYDVRLCNDGAPPVRRLASVTAGMLALAGGASPAWAAEAVRAVAAAVPGGAHRVLDGQDHGVADDVLVPLLAEFLG